LTAHVIKTSEGFELQLLLPTDVLIYNGPTGIDMYVLKDYLDIYDDAFPPFPADIDRDGKKLKPTVSNSAWDIMMSSYEECNNDKNGIRLNAARTYAVANVHEVEAFVYYGDVCMLNLFNHAIFLMAKRSLDRKTVNVTINDPNESSFQYHETYFSAALGCKRDSDPGGWCQTWSTFELECRLAGSSLHDDLLSAIDPSHDYWPQGPHTELANKFIRFFGGTEPADIKTFLAAFKRPTPAWGCSLMRFVRCLALRNIDIAKNLANAEVVDSLLKIKL
jgi:hypothetical protein